MHRRIIDLAAEFGNQLIEGRKLGPGIFAQDDHPLGHAPFRGQISIVKTERRQSKQIQFLVIFFLDRGVKLGRISDHALVQRLDPNHTGVFNAEIGVMPEYGRMCLFGRRIYLLFDRGAGARIDQYHQHLGQNLLLQISGASDRHRFAGTGQCRGGKDRQQ